VTLTPAERSLRNITEAQWQRTVTDLATLGGWLWYHSPANRPVRGRVQNIVAGFPDLTLVRGSRILFFELKRQTGRVTPAQIEWLAALAAAGAEVHILRPSDTEKVRLLLTRIAVAA
jgi:hypothetical protein